MNILVGNSAKQKLEEGQDKLRYGIESTGEAGRDVKIRVTIKVRFFHFF